mgnify:CR=1 FL=1
MNYRLLSSILLITILISINPAFAQELEIKKYVDQGIDWFKIFSQGTINSTDIDPKYKEKMDSAIEDGVPVAKKGIDFWLALHEFIVKQLLGNSPINIGAGIATVISLGIVGFAIFHFLKKMFKVIIIIALIIVALAILFIVLGMDLPFLPKY